MTMKLDPCRVILLSILLACKARETPRADFPEPLYRDKSVSSDSQMLSSIVSDAPLIVMPDGESIVAISEADKTEFAEQIKEALAKAPPAQADSALAAAAQDPAAAADNVVQSIAVIAGAAAAGGAAVGGVVYVRNAMAHSGGPLAYFLKPFSKPYFHINLYLNERQVLKGKRSPYDLIIDYRTDLVKKDGKWGIVVDQKFIPMKESSPIYPQSEADVERLGKVYLGQLPTDNIVSLSGEIDKYLSSNASLLRITDWTNIETISMVEDFERKNISTNISKISQVSTPDNDPVSLGNLKKSSDYTAAILNAGKGAYIHCKSGVGRSAEAAAVHLMDTFEMSATDAGKYVKDRRAIVRVGEDHRHQQAIQDYELLNRPRKSLDLDEDLRKKYLEYKVDAARLDRINEARRIRGEMDLPAINKLKVK